MMGNFSFLRLTLFLFIFLCLMIGSYGCEESGRSLDDLGSGAEFDPRFKGAAEELSDDRLEELSQTLPPMLVPLEGEAGTLYVNGSMLTTAVERDGPLVGIEWSIVNDESRGSGLGMYLRMSDNPIVTDCPSDGTPLSGGITALDRDDGFTHPLRRYYEDHIGRINLVLTDPPLSPGRYYFQGCLIRNLTREFIGIGTNVVQAEIVGQLPDLVTQNAYIFKSGPRAGQMFILVQDRLFRSDIRGDTIEYQVNARRIGGGPPFEASHRGTTSLNTGSGAFIDIPGSDFELPSDGRRYEVTVRINTDLTRLIPESNYENNSETFHWQVNKPAVLVLDRLYVRENCDQRSPGEWHIGGLIFWDSVNQWTLGPVDSSGNISYEPDDIFDTEDDTWYPTNPGQKGIITIRVPHLPTDQPLTVILIFDDCNHYFDGCGEEFREHFGVDAHPSNAGRAEVTLTPLNRINGDSVEAVSREGNCGESAFTMVLRLMNPARAHAEGYSRISNPLPPR